jgi:fibro-slime domain-containing protein
MNAKPILSASLGALSLSTLMAVGVLMSADSVVAVPAPVDPYPNLPSTIRLTGVVRDMKERSVSGGHPDFELNPTRGFGHYVDLVMDQLDADGKPVFKNSGKLVTTEWKDAAGRNRINPRSYIDARSGDRNGAVETQAGGCMTSSERLAQWYRDVGGVNMSAPLSLTLNRQANSNVYTFNDTSDPFYAGRGGFFPINGELWGNSAGDNKNFHFTFELSTTFVFNRGGGQVFSFTGDDDVWVFIDNKLVIDIGGIHGATSQTIELDRLNWLQSGQRYSLKFFMAERHRTQSNFRMDTTITLESAPLPTTAALYD